MNTPTRPTTPESEAATAAAEWALRIASDELSVRDARRLKAWLQVHPSHRQALEHARRVWAGIGPLERTARRTSQSWQRKAAIAVTALAACFALVALVPLLVPYDFSAPTGKVKQSMLADGSLIWLDSGAALDFEMGPAGRTLRVARGRIHISIAHDVRRPFQVVAQDAVIHDVGTAFSVDTEGPLHIAVTEGVVDVERFGSRQRLAAGNAAVFAPGHAAQPTRYSAKSEAAWRNNRIELDRAPLEEALRQADRYRPGVIILMNNELGHRRVSGSLSIERLDESLAALALNQRLRLIRLPYLLIVTSEEG